MKADFRNNSGYINGQESEFTTTQWVENGSEGQESETDCSNCSKPNFPSLSALDPIAKALLVAFVRWSESADVQELRRALSRMLTEIA